MIVFLCNFVMRISTTICRCSFFFVWESSGPGDNIHNRYNHDVPIIPGTYHTGTRSLRTGQRRWQFSTFWLFPACCRAHRPSCRSRIEPITTYTSSCWWKQLQCFGELVAYTHFNCDISNIKTRWTPAVLIPLHSRHVPRAFIPRTRATTGQPRFTSNPQRMVPSSAFHKWQMVA